MKILKNRNFVFPLVVLIIMIITYGLFIPDLGYYLDDWPNVFFDKVGGNAATLLLHASDGRPAKGWYPIILFDLFGYKPLLWQVYNFSLRFLTVIFFWLILKNIWPKSEKQVEAATLLFAVYPIFAQQAIAVTFVPQWTTFLCLFVSIYLMILGIKKPKWNLIFTIAALLISLLGLLISDYFIALEFIRPFILWLLIADQKKTSKANAINVFFRFLPYLAVVLGYVVWRWFIVVLPTSDRLEVSLLTKLAQDPIKESIRFGINILQDLIEILFHSWQKIIQPDILTSTGPVEIAAIGLSIAIAVFAYFTVFKSSTTSNENELTSSVSMKQAAFIGIIMVVLGAVPGWMIDRHVGDLSGIWNDRFGMASMAGAGLVVVALVELLFKPTKWRYVFLVSLIGLSSGWQLRNLNDYRWSWIFQQRFYTQLVWRVPGVEPGTLFLSENEFFSKVGVYPTAFALNTIYPQSDGAENVDFWFLTIPKYFGNDMESFLAGVPVDAGHWQAKFHGQTNNSIVIDFSSKESHCLWILGPEDELNPKISYLTKTSLQVSNLSRITLGDDSTYNNEVITIPEQSNTWCYYFQKADLAQQFKDWEGIESIWNEAQQVVDTMNSGVELVPFIDGFVHLGKYDQAVALTTRAALYGDDMRPYLCQVWNAGIGDQKLTSEDINLLKSLSSDLECGWQY